MGSTAKDREMSTHASVPSGRGTIYLYLMKRSGRIFKIYAYMRCENTKFIAKNISCIEDWGMAPWL